LLPGIHRNTKTAERKGPRSREGGKDVVTEAFEGAQAMCTKKDDEGDKGVTSPFTVRMGSSVDRKREGKKSDEPEQTPQRGKDR